MRHYRRCAFKPDYSRAGDEDNYKDPDYNYQTSDDSFEADTDFDQYYDTDFEQYYNDYFYELDSKENNDEQNYYDDDYYDDDYYEDLNWECGTYSYFGENKPQSGMKSMKNVILTETSDVNKKIIPKGAIISINDLVDIPESTKIYESSKIWNYCIERTFNGVFGVDIFTTGWRYHYIEWMTEHGKSKHSLMDCNVIENEYNDHYLFLNRDDARKHQGVCPCCGK